MSKTEPPPSGSVRSSAEAQIHTRTCCRDIAIVPGMDTGVDAVMDVGEMLELRGERERERVRNGDRGRHDGCRC